MGISLSLLSIAVLLLAAWMDHRARRRVQKVKAYDVSPEAVCLVMQEEDR